MSDLTACGGTASKESSASPVEAAGTYPRLRVVAEVGDFAGPGFAYLFGSREALWQVCRGLLTHKRAPRAAGATVVPALAEAPPTISPDGKVYRFVMRKGVKFSDGTEVAPSDVKYTIERLFFTNFNHLRGAVVSRSGSADSALSRTRQGESARGAQNRASSATGERGGI